MKPHPVLIVLAFSLLTACSKGASPVAAVFGSSPSSVVKDYYTYCNAGEYSRAEETLSADSKRMIHGDLGGLIGGMKGLCDKESRNGTLASIDIKGETIRGEGAVVLADIHFQNNGSKMGDRTALIKESGSWKIASGAAGP